MSEGAKQWSSANPLRVYYYEECVTPSPVCFFVQTTALKLLPKQTWSRSTGRHLWTHNRQRQAVKKHPSHACRMCEVSGRGLVTAARLACHVSETERC